MMTFGDFREKYCALCGSIQCSGIDDEVHRDGCTHYKLIYPYGEDTTICGEDGCDGCFLRYASSIDRCRQIGRKKLSRILNEQE